MVKNKDKTKTTDKKANDDKVAVVTKVKKVKKKLKKILLQVLLL